MSTGGGPRAANANRPLAAGRRSAADFAPSPAEAGRLFLPCAAGVESLLAAEVAMLLGDSAGPIVEQRGGIELAADAPTAMRLNLESRLAMRVLWLVAEGPYRDEQALYELARGVRWRDWLTAEETLRVDTSAQRSPLRSLHFAALRIKDAVCDELREATGARPSVDTRRPHLPLLLHLDADRAALYVDTSGEPLFKRGWRDANAEKGEAPLKETLAAAMIAAAGWRGRPEDGPLLDPCCGAGTIAIEAAQVACGIAPGLERRFAFERLPPFRDHAVAWRAMQRDARERIRPAAVAIHAGDVSFRMTDFAARNAARAGVREAIAFKTADVLQLTAPAQRGTMLLNPPYGERLVPKGRGSADRDDRDESDASPRFDRGRHGKHGEAFAGADDAAGFFQSLAAQWKHRYAGWTAWVLSPEMKLPSLLRLKESRRLPLWNGPIECRLFRFEMVAGSARAEPSAEPAA